MHVSKERGYQEGRMKKEREGADPPFHTMLCHKCNVALHPDCFKGYHS